MQNQEPLLTTYQMGDILLPNRVVMTSLTRCRATNPDLAPTDLHVEYYAQRASAGFILTEGTWISERAVGFINIPGIYSKTQTEAWKRVTDAVHEKNGKIFVQLVHSGSVSHPDFLQGELPLGPSAINPQEKAFTPLGFKDTLTPAEYTTVQIKETIGEYRLAAENAKKAGFDGLEIHAQIFTLIPQFLSEATNQRTDEYGGSIENRARLLFEILDTVKKVYPAKRIGVKFTPAAFNPGIIKPDITTITMFDYILEKLNGYHLAYVELVGPAVDLTGTPLDLLKDNYFEHFRNIYNGTIMANLGFTQESGNAIISKGTADLVSFGTLYIANPDLVQRFEQNSLLSKGDPDTYYAGEAKGFTDYPFVTS
ncbi:MAG: flavoprotein NADH-dependent oxidoreductase [Mucilaginibacter sp.]|nr:flavoprotein NADH-dependent oxidoreductase [Mucilaginibacter sp.]